MSILHASHRRRPLLTVAALAAVALLGACGGAPSADEPSASNEDAVAGTIETGCWLVQFRTSLDPSDAFQAQLLALGCSSSVSYVLDASGNHWFSTSCPETPEVEAEVAAYADVAPYDATSTGPSAANACGPIVPAGRTIVSFDPNCPACM